MSQLGWGFLELTRLLFLFVIYYSLSLLVKGGSLKVNYSRKVVHFAHIVSPLLVNRAFFDYSMDYFLKSGLVTIAFPLLFIESIRKRVSLLDTLFYSFDRPEDRPHTVRLAFTQQLSMYLVLIGLALLYQHSGISLDLLAVPLLITAFGDGLAEPVGIRFGENRYQVTALFTSRTYTRSYEGSSMVLLVTVITLLSLRDLFSFNQILLLLICMPFKMTVVEAYSPHTWDNPFLYLVGGLIVYLVKVFV
jgi:phytol kinase